LVVVAAVLATAIAPDILPTPRQVLAFYEPARLIDVELPPPPPAPQQATPLPDAPTVSPHAAPVVAPSSITPETWAPAVERSGDGVVTGIANGVGADIVGVPDAPPAPPPPAKPAGPARVHDGIRAPEKIVNIIPVYPPLARKAGVKGIVILEAIIDAAGSVTSARVLRGHTLLDQAALDAVQQWKFTPAMLNGEAIPVVITVTVNFTLH
jgi:protein TonB